MLLSRPSMLRTASLLLLSTLCLNGPNGATALPTRLHHDNLDLTNPLPLLEKLRVVELYIETHLSTVSSATASPLEPIHVQKRHHQTDASSITTATDPQATASSDDKKDDDKKKHHHHHCKKPENKDKPECKDKKDKDAKDGGAKKGKDEKDGGEKKDDGKGDER